MRSPDFRLQSGRLAFGAESPRLRTGRRLRRPLSRQAPVQFRYRRVVHRRSTRPASMFTPGRGRPVQATIRCAINSAPDRAGGHPVGRERTPSPLRSDPRRDAKPRGARSRDLERQLERCLQICQVNLSILYSLERRVDSVFSKRGSEARAARDRRLCPNSPFPRIRPIAALPRGADRRDARCRIAFPSACPSHILSCSGRGVAALERRNRQHPRKSRAERRKRD